jgi:hypothetical protein
VAWGRAVVTTLLVAVLACGCQPVMVALLVAYVLIVGLVARAEPRYHAPDGWLVTLAAMAVAAALWGSGGLAFALGRPWELMPEPVEEPIEEPEEELEAPPTELPPGG